MDLNQSRHLYINSERATKKETEEAFLNDMFQFFDREDSLMDEMFKMVGIKKNSTHEQIIDNNGDKFHFKTLPEQKQKERKALREKLKKEMVQAEINFYNGDEEIRKHPHAKDSTRDFVCLFGDRIEPSTDELKGINVANKLWDPDVTPEEKNELFSRYIDDLMNGSMKLMNYSSDKDFVEKYTQLRTIGLPFMADHIENEFEGFAKCKINDKVKEKYENYKALMQSCYSGVNAAASRISDPSYPYLDTKDARVLGEMFSDNGLSLQFENITFGKNVTCQPVETASAGIKNLEYQPKDEKAFEALKFAGIIEDGSNFFDEQGKKLTDKEAGLLFGSHKNLGIIDKSGKMNVITIDENFSYKNTDIPKVYDKKASFKKMLGELDKGTSFFNISGEEYKNMRKTLTNLSNGKGNEKELLESLEKNAQKYLEKHYEKPRISSTAEKRKACVEKMLDHLKEFKLNQGIGEKLRENNLSNAKDANTNNNSSRHHVFIEQDSKNSSRDHLTNNGGISKIKNNIKEQDANINSHSNA